MNKILPEEFPEMVQISENESQKQTDREDNLARLRRLRPIDDTFMRVIFRDDIPLTEFVLRMITGDSDLSLTVQQTQKDLTRLTGARGLSLDVYAEDTRGQLYNLGMTFLVPEAVYILSNVLTLQPVCHMTTAFISFMLTPHTRAMILLAG